METKPTTIPTPSFKKEISFLGVKETISFPNQGQFIDIESNKQLYSNKQYQGLALSNFSTANLAADLVDVIATYSVLIPDFQKRLNIKSISELDILQAKKLQYSFETEYLPWLTEWMEYLNNPENLK